MELNFCTVCYRETCGDLYCSELCRLHDVSAVEEDQTALTPDGSSGGFRLRSFSGSSSSSEEELDRDSFVLPGRRNMSVGISQGRPLSAASRKLGARQPPAAAARFAPERSLSARRPAPLDEEDPELDYLSRLAQPIGLEHRERRDAIPERQFRQLERYVFRREFPSAF